MRLLLCVEESAGIQTIRAIRDGDHEIVAVLTTTRKAEESRLGATVEAVANKFEIPVWEADRVKDPQFAEVMRRESVDILLNVHSLHIVNRKVIQAATIGAFNLHPGPLPRYAGMNAPSWAILDGETSHGVTLHWMEAGIDTGAVAYQTMFDLEPRDTALEVSRRCSRLGLDLIRSLLSEEPDNIPRRPQDLSARDYHGFELPFGGKIPWHDAELFERYVRACNYYPLPSPWGIPTIACPDGKLGLIEVEKTSQSCDVSPGTLAFRGERPRVAAGNRWLTIKRGLVNSRMITW